MDELVRAIHSAQDLEKKVEYYFTLTGDERVSVLKGLGKERNEETGVLLNAIYLQETDRQVRKLIRKTIFRLRSSGVKVEELRPEGEPVLRKVEEERVNMGFLTNFDPSGSRMVMAAYEVRKNTFVFLNGDLHFREGLRELMSSPVDRRSLNEIVAAYRGSTKEPAFLVEISPSYAAFVVEEGARLSGRFTDAIGSLKSFVAQLKDAVHKPDDIHSLPVADDVAPLPLHDVLRHEIFAPFSLSWEGIDEDRKSYLSTGGSTIVLPRHMMEEKKDNYVRDLMERRDIASQEPLFKRLLEDYAYLFHCMGDHGRYRGTLSILRDKMSLDHAFSFFLRKSLEARQDNPAEGDLIIDPYG
ncbi:MAG: hypothetical protein A4E60_02647 [Syntrophorhabdus sp. PtaB.Bin047]|jgi:hypothetical protein|nr:MAG: hypothetical protein A4E60_02647 [Syntrophorhabdus sp. PtaB.Bin047]